MESTKKESDVIPSQGSRTLRDRHGGTIVPGSPASSSCNGPTVDCTARSTVETVIAKNLLKEEEARRVRAGLPCIPVSSSWKVQLQRCDSNSSRKSDKLESTSLKAGSRVGSRSGSRTRSGSRSRGSSASSNTSTRSQSAKMAEEARKQKRTEQQEVLRYMRNAGNRSPVEDDYEDYTDEDTHMDSDVEFVSVEEDKGKGKDKKRNAQAQLLSDLPDPKRGRPPTSGDYVNLTAKKKEYNEQRKIEQELDRYERIKALSAEELYTSMKLDLDEAVENLRSNPNADISSVARENLNEVLRVAKISKNLKGTCTKTLKQGAVVATAAVEVLRTRADGKMHKDVQNQIRSLKRDLDKAKAEAKEAREEVAKLRKELEETKAKKSRKLKGRVIRDTPSPELTYDETEEGESSPQPEDAITNSQGNKWRNPWKWKSQW